MRRLCAGVLALALVAAAAPVVVAEDEHAEENPAPVAFTGQLGFRDCGPHEIPGENVESGLPCMAPTLVEPFSDPRLNGEVSITGMTRQYDGMTVWEGAFQIWNEDGAWQEVPGVRITWPDGTSPGLTTVFVGEGEYSGLLAWAGAVVDGGVYDLSGVIVPGELWDEPFPVSG